MFTKQNRSILPIRVRVRNSAITIGFILLLGIFDWRLESGLVALLMLGFAIVVLWTAIRGAIQIAKHWAAQGR